MKHYDFGGYATRFNVKCTDGRTIRHTAFEDQLPARVPLVWQHQHDTVENCIGHADLEARKDGVYAYCSFTKGEGTSSAVSHAKALVAHGDIDSLSIYANKLVERGGDVMHGVIREVSLVLAAANPGAKIMEYDIAHSSDGSYGAVIYCGFDSEFEEDILAHADEEPENEKEEEPKKMAKEKSVADVLETLNDEQQAAVIYLLDQMKSGKTEETDLKHADGADKEEDNEDETVEDVLNTLTEKQQTAVAYLLDQVKNKGAKDNEEETEMKHNAFENNAYIGQNTEAALSHSDEQKIWKSFMTGKYKSFKDAILDYAQSNGVLAHADTVDESSNGEYGFEDIDWLFPDAKVMSNEPMIIDRRQEWVKHFMDNSTHLPYSRIKSIYADITADDARAKGYAKKGELKVPEVIKLLKHVTHPTTVYKMQKFDKDDLRDITSFDPLKWIDGEMTGKMHEELARAALIGDGRDPLSDPYKIDEDCIVPILNAHDLFAIKSQIKVAANATDKEIALEAMDQAIRAKKGYRGSGKATLYTTEDWVAEMLLIKDVNGRRIFENEAAIANTMRVADIQTVEFMDNLTRKGSDGKTRKVFGIIVNPKDYAFGSDKGSAIETFHQFDIDYNQEKILKETRCSGALRTPYSAIILEIDQTA